ncbi:MAG: long-chain fatty acid--CoA ligase, partial [Propionibacterium sp.]|nr:long-chain fatty acid--CoA ligase [Propionibacterium sp.]
LNPYTPGAYAWWQVTTLALAHPGTSMVCVDATQHWAEAAAEHGVNAASGTPTFWRQALLSQRDELAGVDFKQITLGGEPVDQAVIDLLREAFPNARVSWIYASSEAGASIAFHDGLAGFPAEWLGSAKEGRPTLTVDGDELLIASPHRGDGVAQTLRTGDRVEVRDGRVHITGRLASDEINVGGTKVSVGKVRDTLLAHPGIAWAAIKARRAPVVGQLVQASVVLDDKSLTEDDIIRYSAERLAETEVPRRVRILDEIPLKESLKSDV